MKIESEATLASDWLSLWLKSQRPFVQCGHILAPLLGQQMAPSGFRQHQIGLKLRMKIHQKILKMPLFGGMIQSSIMARFTTVLANLITGGVGLIESVEIAKNSLSNEFIKDGLDKVKRDIYSGRPFAISLRETKAFPETLCGFIEVGEETGKLNDMLTTISKFYEDEFDYAIKNFSQLIEPIMICFLGVIVGFILISMYMPIFKMGSAVTN